MAGTLLISHTCPKGVGGRKGPPFGPGAGEAAAAGAGAGATVPTLTADLSSMKFMFSLIEWGKQKLCRERPAYRWPPDTAHLPPPLSAKSSPLSPTPMEKFT